MRVTRCAYQFPGPLTTLKIHICVWACACIGVQVCRSGHAYVGHCVIVTPSEFNPDLDFDNLAHTVSGNDSTLHFQGFARLIAFNKKWLM